MRKNLMPFYFLAIAILFISVNATAQIETPRQSLSAKVTQTVGLTEITIEYSSPATKKRVIWGSLVPYDKVWRTGANKATMISFSRDVEIGGTKVKKGSYSLFTIPGKDSWEILINKNTELWGSDDYNAEEDVVRIKATPVTIPHRERMTFIFADFEDHGATINLEWEKVRVSFRVNVFTDEQVMASISKTLHPDSRSYYRAAQYVFEAHGANDQATEWIDKSLELESTWFNNWIKAQMLESTGDIAGAIKYGEIAKSLGDKDPDNFFYKDRVDAALAKWNATK